MESYMEVGQGPNWGCRAKGKRNCSDSPEPIQPSYPMAILALSQGVKLPGREVDHSPQSSPEAKNGGAMPPPPVCFHGIVLNYLSRGTISPLSTNFMEIWSTFWGETCGSMTQQKRLLRSKTENKQTGICSTTDWWWTLSGYNRQIRTLFPARCSC
jgi:hypothetical protein